MSAAIAIFAAAPGGVEVHGAGGSGPLLARLSRASARIHLARGIQTDRNLVQKHFQAFPVHLKSLTSASRWIWCFRGFACLSLSRFTSFQRTAGR